MGLRKAISVAVVAASLAGCASDGMRNVNGLPGIAAGIQSSLTTAPSRSEPAGSNRIDGPTPSISMIRDALMVRYELPREVGNRMQLRVGWGFTGRAADNPMMGGASCDLLYLAEAYVPGGVKWGRMEYTDEDFGHACARNEWGLALHASPMNSPLRRINNLDPNVVEEQVKAFSAVRDKRMAEIRNHAARIYFFAGAGLQNGLINLKTGVLPLSIRVPDDVFPPFSRSGKTVNLVGPGIGPDHWFHVKATLDPSVAREISALLAPFSGQLDHQHAVVSFQVIGGSERGNTVSLNVRLLEVAFDVHSADRQTPPIRVTVPLMAESRRSSSVSRSTSPE